MEILSSDRHDEEIRERAAFGELRTLFTNAFGVDSNGADDLRALRKSLGRTALITEFVTELGEFTPAAMRSMRMPSKSEARKALLDLTKTWRNRLDFAASYVEAANEVERDLRADIDTIEIDGLMRVETFEAIELALQSRIERAMREGSGDLTDLIRLAERRADGFWSKRDVPLGQRWHMVVDAGRLLALADHITQSLKSQRYDACRLFAAYVDGDDPWCLLDTYHRSLLSRYHDLDVGLGDGSEGEDLQKLVVHVRNRHGSATADPAEAFTDAYARSRFTVEGVLTQSEVFARRVRPLLEQRSRVAYVLVDALRFEMGRDVANWPQSAWDVELSAAIATFPSMTKVGMASLMPGAENGIALREHGKNFSVEIGDTRVDSRDDRLKLLDRAMPPGWEQCYLGDLTPPSQSLLARLQAAPAVFVTSQEIDQLGESGNAPLARQVMSEVLRNLGRAFTTLGNAGFDKIVVTADHGYLFGDDVSDGDKIDTPGGNQVDLHRRVWIGHGGSASPSVLRMTGSDLGIGGDLEFATPMGTAVFQAPGGSLDYFHGGMSLQELAIPVIELTRRAAGPSGADAALIWEITTGSRTISSRFVSVTVKATTQELLPVAAPRVLIELRQAGATVGVTKTATYGFEESGAVQLRLHDEDPREIEPNTIMLLLDRPIENTSASVIMADATTGRVLKQLDDIPVSIAF